MAELRIISQPLNEHSWLTTVSGNMDAANFNVMEDEFNRLLEAGARGIALDVSGLETISSSGLGGLVNLSSLLRDRNGKLVVFSPTENLAGLAAMLGLGDALLIVPTQNDANRELATVR